MNANIMKGERSKLLAAVAVLVMMVCVFAVAIPNSDAADPIEVPEGVALPEGYDMSADEDAVYIVDSPTTISGVNFNLPAGESIYIKSGGSLSFDGGAEGTEMKIDGIIYILNGGSLELSSSTLKIGEACEFIAEAGSKVTISSDTLKFNSDIVGDSQNTNAFVQLTDGTATISGITLEAGDMLSAIANGYPVSVELDGDATINQSKLTATLFIQSIDVNLFGDDSNIVIGEGSNLVVAGAAVETSGTIINNGSVSITGVLDASGTITNNGSVTVSGTVDNTAEFANVGTLKIEETGTVTSDAPIVGAIDNLGTYIEAIDGENAVYHVGSVSALKNAFTTATSIVLDKDIEADESISLEGKTLDLNGNDLTLTGENTLSVGTDSKLIVGKGSTLASEKPVSVTDIASIVTEEGSTVDASFTTTGKDTVYPEYEDGTVVTIGANKVMYTVYHTDTMAGTVQFGVAVSDFTYDGKEKAGPFRNAAVVSLDNNYPQTSGQPTGYVYQIDLEALEGGEIVAAEGVDPTSGDYGTCIDVGTYGLHISFTMTNGGETVNVEADVTVDIVPAASELEFGDYNAETVYGVAKGDLIDGTIAATVEGTDVTLTGTLLYYSGNGWDANVWPADETEGYYVLFSVDWMSGVKYDDASVVLSYSGKTYSAETFDNFMLVYLGKAPELGSMQMTVDYDGEGANFTATTYDISFASLSLQSYIYIGEYADETVYDVSVAQLVGSFEAVQVGHVVTITADLYYYAGGAWAAGTWAPEESEGYYIVFSVDNPTGAWAAATFKVNGNELSTQPFDGYLVNYLGTVLPETESVEIAVDLDGAGTKYTESEFTVDMELTSSVSIFFDAIDSDDTYDIGNVSIGDLQSADTAVTVDSVEGEENVYDVVFTGTLNWVSSYTWYNSAVETEQRGYYLGFEIALPGNMSWDDAVLKTENKTFDSENPFDGFFIWRIINDYDSTITIEIDGTTYTYNLDFSQLSFAPKAGFVPVAEDILDGEDYVVEGIDLPDVIDNTYYLIFNTGKTEAGVGDYTMMLFKGESAPADLSGAVYTETADWQQIADGAYIWYFSLDDQLKGLDLAGGNYTLAATIGGEVVAQATITFGGTADCGYGESAQEAIGGMTDAGYPVDSTDVSDQTMWIVWYNAEAVTTDVTAKVTLGGEEIYTQTIESWKTAGVHGWYFCFGDNPGSIGVDLQYRTYVITVTDAYGNVLAQGEVPILDKSKYTVMLDEKDDAYDREFFLGAGEIFYLPESGIDGETVKYWEVLDENGQVIGTVNAGALVVIGSDDVYFSSENVYSFRAYYSEGGDVPETGPVYQLPEYNVETVVDEGSLIVNVSVDRLNGYNGFSALRISYTGMVSDYDGYIPWIIDSPDANGIVASCNVSLYADDEITGPVRVTVLAFIGDTWEPIDSTIVDVGGTVTEEPLLNDDVDGDGNPMTFTVIETPTTAPEEHNYPWLQVDYERLQDVDSVELIIDGESISFNWVDQDGDAIEQPEIIPAGEAFFQLSYADGDVVAGEVIEITIRVTAGEATDEITMTITVPTPDSEY